METSEIVSDYLHQRLTEQNLAWPNSPSGVSTNKVCVSLRILCEEFRTRYVDSFEQMFTELNLKRNRIAAENSFREVLNELFKEGVKWSHIVALFVFSAELASSYGERNWTELIDCLVVWLTSYIDTNLLHWIEEHGGWAGLVRYQEGSDGNRQSEFPWKKLKTWFSCVAAGAIGAITLGAFLASKS